MSPIFQLLTDSFIKLLINTMYCKELPVMHGYYFFLFNPIPTAQVCHRFLTAQTGAPVMEAVNNLNNKTSLSFYHNAQMIVIVYTEITLE